MIYSQYDLSAHNTLRLPGKAQAFASFSSLEKLQELLHWAQTKQLPLKILGQGSNILLSGDVNALVLNSHMQAITVVEQTATTISVAVDAGLAWHDWVIKSLDYGHGLENLALIPGTVGAAPVQNIGAYGVEVGRFIQALEGMDVATGQIHTLSAVDCEFAYRDSIFKRQLAGQFFITRVIFCLPLQFNPVLDYGPLAKLERATLTGESLLAAVCDIRRSKLPNPEHIPNAGSFFKNPLVSAAQSTALLAQYPDLPHYPQDDGQVKLAAGWLIEQTGFKGQWRGNVRMHEAQALVLTTNGQASFAEVIRLRDAVVHAVQQRFAVTLEAEPQIF